MKKITRKSINKKLKELKVSSFKKKIIICIIASLFSLLCINFLINKLENIVDNYDYSKVEEKQGVIIKEYESRIYDEGSERFKNFEYIDIKLTSGEIVTISLGNHSEYTEGEKIIIYTNGEDYSITKEGVALDENNSVFYFIFMSLIVVAVIYIWFYLFGVKGFFIAMFLFLIVYSIFFA